MGPALRRLAQTFARTERGAAIVEFALILPVMLLLYLGTIEGGSLISMDRRVQTIAASVGDLVARHDGAISSAQLLGYFRASRNIISPFPEGGVIQTVSLVSIDASGTSKVEWSRRYRAGNALEEGHARTATVALPAEMMAIATPGFVIVAEAEYAYRPLLGIVFDQDYRLYRDGYYMPRFGETIAYVP